MKWEILISEEYEKWFNKLPKKYKIAIATDLSVLGSIGPTLGRPYVDQMNDSKFKNLKELRTNVSGHVYRSLFAFDPSRRAVILCGGDKKGKNQEKFYKALISQAEIVFEKHLINIQKTGVEK